MAARGVSLLARGDCGAASQEAHVLASKWKNTSRCLAEGMHVLDISNCYMSHFPYMEHVYCQPTDREHAKDSKSE